MHWWKLFDKTWDFSIWSVISINCKLPQWLSLKNVHSTVTLIKAGLLQWGGGFSLETTSCFATGSDGQVKLDSTLGIISNWILNFSSLLHLKRTRPVSWHGRGRLEVKFTVGDQVEKLFRCGCPPFPSSRKIPSFVQKWEEKMRFCSVLRRLVGKPCLLRWCEVWHGIRMWSSQRFVSNSVWSFNHSY